MLLMMYSFEKVAEKAAKVFYEKTVSLVTDSQRSASIIDQVRRHKKCTYPAAVFCTGTIPESVRRLGSLAMWRLVKRIDARKLVREAKLESFHMGNSQGLVGAAGVIGYDFGSDSTLEMLSYRKPSMFGLKRNIDEEGVKRMQQKTSPDTFSSYDEKRDHVMISPRGPDPVLYGIRGESARSVIAASMMIKTGEKSAGYMIFQSNQGTSRHLDHKLDASSLEPYMAGTISGSISKTPQTLQGGHVIFNVLTANGSVPCAVYKESGMGGALCNLAIGDEVTVGGGIRPASKSRPRTMNVEFVRVRGLKIVHEQRNPHCIKCHKTIEMISQRLECWYVFYAVPDESNVAVQILLEDTLQDVARVQLEWSLYDMALRPHFMHS